MTKTNTTILFGRNALNMRVDFSVTVNAGGEQPLALAADLTNENAQSKYATFENNFWLMDGSFKFMPAIAQVGYISTELSGAAGAFTTAPQLQFDFTDFFDTNGLTLYFGEATGDYCNDVDVAFYDTSQTAPLIRTDNYAPTGTTFSTGQAVTNFNRIIITFNSTNNAYRLARLINIDFDAMVRWSGDNVRNARLVEESDPLSLEITSNQIEFNLFSSDADFSIMDPQNEFAVLQENEPIDIYQQIDDENFLIGRFYLVDWESISENEAHFSAYDAIYLMDEPLFYCTANGASVTGIYYLDEMIARIMAAAGVDYEIDASLIDVPAWDTFSGMMPVMSCREALQHACFALGAVVSCARSRIIQITPFETITPLSTFDITLTSANRGQNPMIKQRKAFTALDVYSYAYSRIYYDIAYNILFSQADMPNGTYTQVLETPTQPTLYNDDTDTPVTPDDYGRYWIRFTINDTTLTDYAVIDSGYYFEKFPKRYLIDNNTVPATTPTNIIVIDRAILLKEDDYPYSQTITQAIQRLVEYYRRRFEQTTKTFGLNVTAGDSVETDAQGASIYGIIERAEIDLTGGFVANLKIVGITDRAAQSVKWNDDDARFVSFGFTGSDTHASYYNGDLITSPNAQTGWIEFFFIGYQFVFVHRKDSAAGSVDIYIDDVNVGTLDQYNATTLYQQEWTSAELTNTYHKVRLEKVGTSGIINLDAIEVFYK